MACLIPKTTKAEVKVMNRMSMNKIIGILLTLGLSSLFSNVVHAYLRIPFIIFCVIIFFILCSKAPSNPTMSFWKGLLLSYQYLLTNKKLYSEQSPEYIEMKESEAIELAEKESKNLKKATHQ